MGGVSVEDYTSHLEWEEARHDEITEDRNEADREQTARTHLPKWTLRREVLMLQYWDDLTDIWGTATTVACVSKANSLPPKGLIKGAAIRVSVDDEYSKVD